MILSSISSLLMIDDVVLSVVFRLLMQRGLMILEFRISFLGFSNTCGGKSRRKVSQGCCCMVGRKEGLRMSKIGVGNPPTLDIMKLEVFDFSKAQFESTREESKII